MEDFCELIETCLGRTLSLCLLSCYACCKCCEDLHEWDGGEEDDYMPVRNEGSDEEGLTPEHEW